MTIGRNAGFLIRSVLALILVVGSFLTLRERWHGSCILPFDGMGDVASFPALSVIFLVGIVWLVAEPAYRIIALTRVQRHQAIAWSIATGFIVYAVPTIVGLFTFSLPQRSGDDWFYRLYLSVFWAVGILNDTGNFSTYACGQ